MVVAPMNGCSMPVSLSVHSVSFGHRLADLGVVQYDGGDDAGCGMPEVRTPMLYVSGEGASVLHVCCHPENLSQGVWGNRGRVSGDDSVVLSDGLHRRPSCSWPGAFLIIACRNSSMGLLEWPASVVLGDGPVSTCMQWLGPVCHLSGGVCRMGRNGFLGRTLGDGSVRGSCLDPPVFHHVSSD